MPVSITRHTLFLFTILVATFVHIPIVIAEPYYQGPESCEECHEDIYKSWEKTKHFTSYRTAHKEKNAKKIAEAVGTKKGMKRNKDCIICHYSTKQKKADDKPKVKNGPSCENCHGASSDWESVHSDYGGKKVKKEQEAQDHKVKRINDSTAGGLIWASMHYDLAVNCAKCHGLARQEINEEAFGKMLEAEHTINHSFEIVMFSQGKMSHWEDKRSKAQLANLFIAGQAAKLVSASRAASEAKNEKYKEEQLKRVSDAAAILKVIPEAAALIKSPSDTNAREMMKAIKEKDLSGLVGKLIPCAGPDEENLKQC